MRSKIRTVILCFAASLLLAGGQMLTAQTKSGADKPPTGGQTSAPVKKPSAGPFHGKVAAVDQGAKTIHVGKRTFHISAETKIRKNGKPARLEDAVVGEPCSGYVKPDDTDRLIATTLNLGPKTESTGTSKKTEKKSH